MLNGKYSANTGSRSLFQKIRAFSARINELAEYDSPVKSPVKSIETNVGMNKEPIKEKEVRKVTFSFPGNTAPDAKCVCIVGDFNNWDTHADPMKRLENGDFTIILDLEPGKEYQYRFFIDESRWENDRNADKYAKSLYGNCDNSVVIT